MGATVVDITRDGRTGTFRRAPLSRETQLEFTDVYWVETTDGRNDDVTAVMKANGLPQMGDPHPRVPGVVVTGIDPQPVTGRIDRWRVAVHYEMEHHEAPDVDIDFEIHRVPVMGATAVKRITLNQGGSLADAGANFGVAAQQILQWGTPILTSAGESFIPVPEDEEAFLVLHVSRNELIFDLKDACDFNNSMNLGKWMDKDPLQWLMMRKGRPIPNSRAKWWRMEYIIKYNKFGWDLQLLDQGRYYRATPGIPPAGALIPFKDDEKNNVTGNLDGTGGALAAGNPPWWLHFRRKEVLDWAPLQLEETIKEFFSDRKEFEIRDPQLDRHRKEAAAAGFGF